MLSLRQYILLDGYWIIQLAERYKNITTIQLQIENDQENLTNCEHRTIYLI